MKRWKSPPARAAVLLPNCDAALFGILVAMATGVAVHIRRASRTKIEARPLSEEPAHRSNVVNFSRYELDVLAMFERLMFRKIEVWLVLLMAIFGTIAALLFGWAAQSDEKLSGRLGHYALKIAGIPNPAMEWILGTKKLIPQLVDFNEFHTLKPYTDDNPSAPYILVSAYSDRYNVATAYLYDLKINKKVYEWIPPVDAINELSSPNEKANKDLYRTQHPYLMPDGSIIFSSGEGPLVRLDRCSKIEWVIDRHFHHSINMGPNGNLFVPIIADLNTSYKALYGPDTNNFPLRDDGFAEISPAGKILNEWSIAQILIQNGYGSLLLGVTPYEEDRIHLNDVEPMLAGDHYVEMGDVVLSIHNLSSIALFRPSTGKIVWLHTGPWLHQHDVDYRGDGKFVLFGNDSVRTHVIDQHVIIDQYAPLRGYSTIYQYDARSGEASELLKLKKYGIYSPMEGRQQYLSDGSLFIESTHQSVLYILNRDGSIAWKYVSSTHSRGKIGALHWSRVIPRVFGERVLKYIGERRCS
jgi:hypothetical protein